MPYDSSPSSSSTSRWGPEFWEFWSPPGTIFSCLWSLLILFCFATPAVKNELLKKEPLSFEDYFTAVILLFWTRLKPWELVAWVIEAIPTFFFMMLVPLWSCELIFNLFYELAFLKPNPPRVGFLGVRPAVIPPKFNTEEGPYVGLLICPPWGIFPELPFLCSNCLALILD